jgi:hypothetical protein
MHICPQEVTVVLTALLCLSCAKTTCRWALSRLSERAQRLASYLLKRVPYTTLMDAYEGTGPKGRRESS